MPLDGGERQVAPTLDGIRRDHLARYHFAARHLAGQRVLDLACGVGYGAAILADAGCSVVAIDRSEEAVAYGRAHYDRAGRIGWHVADLATAVPDMLPASDAAVCFETIEHLADPLPLLRALRARVPVLLASVPNESRFPYTGQAFHFRHYTRDQFEALLRQAGFEVDAWFGQAGPESDLEPDLDGRTLVAVARRSRVGGGAVQVPMAVGDSGPELHYMRLAADDPAADARAVEVLGQAGVEALDALLDADAAAALQAQAWAEAVDRLAAVEARPVPKHVAIVGLGPSRRAFFDLACGLGGASAYCDEVWGCNSLGDVLRCDRVFHMDDLQVQEARSAAKPESHVTAMVRWLKSHPGPVYTSVPRPGYPGLVPFPLERVLNRGLDHNGGAPYFNGTTAYMVAYAAHIGVERISCFGLDFTRANAHDAERGRACVEYWLGVAAARGIVVTVPEQTALLDACAPEAERLYGYDRVEVHLLDQADGTVKVELAPRAGPVDAAEVEARYDHSRHPNRLVEAAARGGRTAEETDE